MAAARSWVDAASWAIVRRARRRAPARSTISSSSYALDSMLTLPANATRLDVLKAMDGHIVGTNTYYAFLARMARA